MVQDASPTRASSQSVEDVFKDLAVQLDEGLTTIEVKYRQQKYGPNRLEQAQRRSRWQILIAQFKSPIIALLAIAVILSFTFQEWIEGFAVLIAISLNAAIGLITEIKAVQSMEALHQLSQTHATVRRQGQVKRVSAEELVPGDIVLLEAGDLIPADLRLIELSKLQVDESTLTGESVSVVKTLLPLEPNLSLAEQKNLLFNGTAITRGSGTGVVVATGMQTELGQISKLTAEAEEEVTPLEKRLDQLGRRLIWITLVVATLVAVAGVLGGKDLVLMVETAIALSVAAVPEGLPIVATVALARGMWRMAKRNALINRLSAVETLGATSIICTDKTGTLTENRMTVTQIALTDYDIQVIGEALDYDGKFVANQQPIQPYQHDHLLALLEVGVLCNNAVLPDPESKEAAIGDPTEVALLMAGAKAELHRDALLKHKPELREVAFDSDSKRMATIHQTENGYLVAVKGALESLLPVCSHQLTAKGQQDMGAIEKGSWQKRSHKMAAAGLRVLGLAQKQINTSDSEPYQNLTWLGLVGLTDPPRKPVKQAIQACQKAGIRVIMVTGDQPITARSIGTAVGLIGQQEIQVKRGEALNDLDQLSELERQQLLQVPIFARVSPKQKLNLIQLHQQNQSIVAMTGDGVNDAPALKKADIGIAMGERGTQVAKEAADMVLQDDAFSTIVAAIAQGRAIFSNIRKFTLYLLSGNVGEIIAVAITSLIGAPLPLLPLQILFLNAVNDVFPALALGVGEGNPAVMEYPPRNSQEPILTRRYWIIIGIYGLIIAAVDLGVFAISLQVLALNLDQAVTLSFLTLAFARLWHVFNMREPGSDPLRNEITVNPYIWGALAICTGLLLAATYAPGLSTALQLVDPGLQGWGFILGASLIPLVLGQLVQRWR